MDPQISPNFVNVRQLAIPRCHLSLKGMVWETTKLLRFFCNPRVSNRVSPRVTIFPFFIPFADPQILANFLRGRHLARPRCHPRLKGIGAETTKLLRFLCKPGVGAGVSNPRVRVQGLS